MDNRIKMKIKSIPFLSSLAKGFNRTAGRCVRRVASYPSQRKDNAVLLGRLSRLSRERVARIWYFGVPRHSNLGDQAQKFCIYRWLRTNYPDRDVIPISSVEFNGGIRRTLVELKQYINPEDIIVMQSGHTMDGIHIDEYAHRSIPRTFKKNRIVFFPTSIAETSKRGLKKDSRCIDPHPRMLFLARDSVSCGKAKKLYPHINVHLCPDVVTSLIGSYSFSFEREGILLCTRNDGEKLYTYEAIDGLAIRLAEISSLDSADTTVEWKGLDFDSDEAWRRIEEVIASYAKYRVVVTDRYHGTIFARIAGTPVVVLKTTDHKVVSGAQWFIESGDEAIAVAEKLEEVPDLARRLMHEFPNGKEAPAFAAPYYDHLRNEIETM